MWLDTETDIIVFGEHDEKTLQQIRDVRTRAVRAALMADGHLGYIMPIGGVAAYENAVSVAGVGFDIACGNCAIKTNIREEQLIYGWDVVGDEIQYQISFGVGRSNRSDDAPVNHPLFERDEWNIVHPRHRQALRDLARNQLGTVGSGNHYVDVFTDEGGFIWVGVHFGSRGFGHKIASNFMALSQGEKWGTRVKEAEALLSLDTQLGQDYWAMMNLAGEYAYAGREWVASKIALQFGTIVDTVHNNHNFAWREEHLGRELIVVRKGATPAFPGQRGFVGGSMGDHSVILEGVQSVDSAVSLYSTVHGAGRVMSRTQARGKIHRKTGRIITPGLVSPEMMFSWLEDADVVLRGGGLDESPHAYRRLDSVLEEQGDTINVLHRLRPRVVVMAGADEFDPYKD